MGEDDGRDAPPHVPECGHSGVINPKESDTHRHKLLNAVNELKHHIKIREIKEVMQKLVKDIKWSCTKVYTPISEASMVNVVHAVKDPCGLALHLVTEEIKNALEDIMPDEDMPEGLDVMRWVHEMKPISLDMKDLIVILLDHTAATCRHASLTAECLSSLAKVCTPEQLMLIMKCLVQPMVQVVVAPGFLDPPAKLKR